MTHPLCAIAVDAIAHALCTGTRRLPARAGLEPDLLGIGASFVTLEREGRLLGCVGTLEASRPLAIDVAAHACAAAFDDPRVPPITAHDFAAMSVKVSVLSPSTVLAAAGFAELRAAVHAGRDGLTVEARAGRAATLLPAVWATLPDRDDFLDALWLKAGLRPRTWPAGMRVSRYTTAEFTDHGPRELLHSRARAPQ